MLSGSTLQNCSTGSRDGGAGPGTPGSWGCAWDGAAVPGGVVYFRGEISISEWPQPGNNLIPATHQLQWEHDLGVSPARGSVSDIYQCLSHSRSSAPKGTPPPALPWPKVRSQCGGSAETCILLSQNSAIPNLCLSTVCCCCSARREPPQWDEWGWKEHCCHQS